MNLLLDTNVYIDFLGGKKPFFPDAQAIVISGYFNDNKLWVAGQTINDAFFVLSKYIGSQKVQRSIAKSLQVITPASLQLSDYEHALRLGWPDLEDCLIAVTAEKVRADYVVTRDVRGFDRSMVPAITPSELTALMRDELGLDYGEVRL